MMELHYFEELPSTNDVAFKAAQEGAPAFYTVMAGRQSAGRGRMTRSFYSPQGGTYFSVVLRPTLPRALWGAITPFAALAVRRAVLATLGIALDIKWVNDLLWGGKKVCGILSRAGTDQNGCDFVVVGIGINTFTAPLPRELADIADTLPATDPQALAAAVVAELQCLESELRTDDWRLEYRSGCSFFEEYITVHEQGRTYSAFALDIASDGALVVLDEQGKETRLCGEEITVRRHQEY